GGWRTVEDGAVTGSDLAGRRLDVTPQRLLVLGPLVRADGRPIRCDSVQQRVQPFGEGEEGASTLDDEPADVDAEFPLIRNLGFEQRGNAASMSRRVDIPDCGVLQQPCRLTHGPDEF